MRLARGDWVAVLDGSRATIFKNTGTARAPQLTVERTETLDNPPTHEQGRERPGRTYAPVGKQRSGVEAPDLHQRAEDEFLRAVVASLAAEAETGAFDRIVICAPPKALAVIREAMAPALRSRVAAELNQDLTRLSPADVTAAVVKALEA